MSKRHVYLCLSLDVEEEGLFRGSYGITSTPTTNLAHLHRLRPLCNMGARPTLFCAWPVLADDTAWGHVASLAEAHPVEIGAHLHHWNTPPLYGGTRGAVHSVPSAALPDSVFAAKLESVLEEGRRRTGSRPVSFRMGRWDLHARHWPILAAAGIRSDASVRPLHRGTAANLAPDHFLAPRSGPYLVATPSGSVFEAPLTVTPLLPPLAGMLRSLGRQDLEASLQHWGALALLPVYHPLWAMKAVTALSTSRGNDLIMLTWHSSEMMPGGNPRMPDVPSIDRFMYKCTAWLAWLLDNFSVTFVTLDELRRLREHDCRVLSARDCDWTAPPIEE